MREPNDSEIATLRDWLRRERECCAALVDVLRAERTAAAGHDLQALVAALREREAIQARWEAVARRRGELLAAIGGDFAGASASDPELGALRAGLAEEAHSVRREQSINEAVLRQSLDSVNDLLAAIRRHLPGARYDRRAGMTAATPEGSHAGWRA
ncbi:MAG TPA: flagellar export chaperone FlgN [Candidatus Binatia bacterium]|nr:flagellar export chaperone FlgN [Candidatus Binatia bacterium]